LPIAFYLLTWEKIQRKETKVEKALKIGGMKNSF
jgi:hypothetical protein